MTLPAKIHSKEIITIRQKKLLILIEINIFVPLVYCEKLPYLLHKLLSIIKLPWS